MMGDTKKRNTRARGRNRSRGKANNTPDTLTHREILELSRTARRPPPLTPEAEKAIIQERIQGLTVAGTALRYQVTESTVRRVYSQFLAEVAKAKRTDGETPDQFNKRIIKKARRAVVAGVDCNRDPYRRGALGVRVLEGVGEFKPAGGATINNNFALVQATPAEFRNRYLSLPEPTPGGSNESNNT